MLQGNTMALDQLDTFAETIKLQESSGDYNAIGPVTKYGRALGAYGIVEANWKKWAKQAGIPGADWHDPRAQDKVAKYKMTEYYNKYNSWDLVAIAWFAGPGNADIVMRNTDLQPLMLKEDAKNLPNIMTYQDVLGKSVGDYVNDIMTNMNNELKNKGLPEATRYTAKPRSKQVSQAPVADENFAINLLNALSQNTAGGQRKNIAVPQDFISQVPREAGSYEGTQIKTNIRRGEQ